MIAEIDQFAASLAGLRQALANGDEAELRRLFRQSTARRRRFDRRGDER